MVDGHRLPKPAEDKPAEVDACKKVGYSSGKSKNDDANSRIKVVC